MRPVRFAAFRSETPRKAAQAAGMTRKEGTEHKKHYNSLILVFWAVFLGEPQKAQKDYFLVTIQDVIEEMR
jgi:hypothetical protein